MLASTNPSEAAQMADQYPQLVRDVLPKPFDLDDPYAKLGQPVGVLAP